MDARPLLLILVLCASSCAAASGPFKETHIEGYARYSGELLIFDSREPPPDDLTDRPRCLSAVPSKDFAKDLRNFDHKHIIAAGYLIAYDQLPNEGGVRGLISPRKSANGFIVSNFCRGKSILVLQSVRILP